MGKFVHRTIDVSKENIEQGERAKSRYCMVVQAIKDEVPDSRGVRADIHTIAFSDPKRGRRYTFQTPFKAAQAIVDFDDGRHVEPFRFTLYTPLHIETIKARGQRTLIKKEGHHRPTVIEGKPAKQTRRVLSEVDRQFGLKKLHGAASK